MEELCRSSNGSCAGILLKGADVGLLDRRAYAGLLMKLVQVLKITELFASLLLKELLQASTSIPIELSEVFESRDSMQVFF